MPEHTIRMIRFPIGFRKYPYGKSDLHGSIEVDLGRWATTDGDEGFHLRIDVASLPTLIEAIKKSKGGEKTLYRCLTVFRSVPESE